MNTLLHNQGRLLCLHGWDGLKEALPVLSQASRLLSVLEAAGKLPKDKQTWPAVFASWQKKVEEILAAKEDYRLDNPDSAFRLADSLLALNTESLPPELVNYALDLLRGIPDGSQKSLLSQKLLVAELEELHQEKEMLVHLEKWLALEPSSPDALDKQAGLFFEAKDYRSAAVSYGKLLRIWRTKAEKTQTTDSIQESARAWLNTATSLRKFGDTKAAEHEFLTALAWFLEPVRRGELKDSILQCQQRLADFYFSDANEPQKALEIQETLMKDLSVDLNKEAKLAFLTGRSRTVLAVMQVTCGKSKEATTSSAESLKLLERLFRLSPSKEYFEECTKVWRLYTTLLKASGEKEEALRQANRLIEFCRVPEATPFFSDAERRSFQISSHERAEDILQALQQYTDACTHSAAVVALAREEFNSLPEGNSDWSAAVDKLASALGNHAWALILAKNFEAALEAARESFKLDSRIWVEGNLAHALLFSGNFDEAMQIYTKHRGQKIEINGNLPWEEMVKVDFEKFRAEGLDHSDFPRVEAALGIDRTAQPAPPKK